MRRKLIEVSLPLKEISSESAREKSIRHGHPSTMHLWWSRKPLAACRTVIFASLVDDPSCNPERFPTEEEQQKERERLHDIIKRLVVWENVENEDLYKDASNEILSSTDGTPPPILDPFAGGGSIPLEAQRLGLEVYAGDINPVAVVINKALIEIPPRFAGRPPVNPESRKRVDRSARMKGAAGLAEDIRYYGEWVKREAYRRIGHLYPRVRLPNGSGEADVIAWKWARTVRCPNPACGAEMPLVSGYWLSKKKGKEAWVLPRLDRASKSVHFEVRQGGGDVPDGTVNRRGARCEFCGAPVGLPYIREEAKAGRMGARLMAVVADGKNGRVYVGPDEAHERAANIPRPEDYPDGELPQNPRWFSPPAFGMSFYADLFTPRQLTALVTFSDLVREAIEKARADASDAGLPDDGMSLETGGHGARAYGEAVGVYLACALDKLADRCSTICSWDTTRDCTRNTFARQAIPMVWDFAEANPFSSSSGCWGNCVDWVAECVEMLPARAEGHALQHDAKKMEWGPVVIVTDPPYYDNIGYADLSDFFYVWLRQTIGGVYPSLFRTMQTPKSDELVATPYRFGGNSGKSREFFERGMYEAFKRMRDTARPDYPLTVFYAYKQQDGEDDGNGNGREVSSPGWETMLQALVDAGFTIVRTWPMRTEMTNRPVANGTNSLNTSVAIVCRPRPHNAPKTTLRVFRAELVESTRKGLREVMSANIPPVDLPQSAIGPGIEVFSKYSEVMIGSGAEKMSVHYALVLINKIIDEVLAEQDGEMDGESRFCITWFEQFGLGQGKFGDAENMAKARLANIEKLKEAGILFAEGGVVRLMRRDELPEKWDPSEESIVWAALQHLCRSLLEGRGEEEAAWQIKALSESGRINLASVRSLAYRAYVVAERNGWASEALAYNSLVSIWEKLQERIEVIRKNNLITGKDQFSIM